MSKTTLKAVSKDREIIYENFQAVAKKVGEDFNHASLKGCGGVAQSERHAFEGECCKRTCERRHLLIFRVNCSVVVA